MILTIKYESEKRKEQVYYETRVYLATTTNEYFYLVNFIDERISCKFYTLIFSDPFQVLLIYQAE